MKTGRKHSETVALHFGYWADPTTNAVAVPIYQTTSYQFKSNEHAANLFGLAGLGNIYTRIMNPTNDVLEQRISAIEGSVAALAQTVGSLAAKPALLAGGDRMVAAAIKLGCAALCHSLFQHVRPALTKCHVKLSLRDLSWVCLSSLNAIALGMTLFIYVLANRDVGWVLILSSTAPIMTLPMLCSSFGIHHRRVPGLGRC